MARLWLVVALVAALFADHGATAEVPRVTTPAIDASSLASDASAEAAAGRISGNTSADAPRFAVPFDSQVYSPTTDGVWEVTPDGWNVWRLVVECPGALHVNLGFSSYKMPEGGSLVIASSGNTAPSTTTFTSADNDDVDGELWTPIYLGDTVTLEVALPPKVTVTDLQLLLTSINAGFRGFGGDDDPSDKSGSCNVDVVCGEGDGWRPEISAVAVYSQGGSRFCTGALINNAVGNGTPYFLTANHCGINSNREARSLVVYWNYQTTACGVQPNGNLSQNQRGATFVAGWATSDFTLLKLNSKPNEAWNVHYAGWDRSGAAMSGAIAIHHPNADEKRISFENNPTSTTNWSSNTVTASGTHIRVADWDLGTTEPGSSGSPLFDPNHRVVGQLHGGGAACGNDEPDWYGRFFRSWEGGGRTSRRLKDWLDPNNTGALTVNTARITASGPVPTPTAPTPPAGPTPPTGPAPTPTGSAPTPSKSECSGPWIICLILDLLSFILGLF
jgi:lysyl endopeptidase